MEHQLSGVEMGSRKKLAEMDNVSRTTLRRERARSDAQRAIAHSLKYNNALFLFCVILMAYFVFVGFTAPLNYILSVSSAAALVYFQSNKEVMAQAAGGHAVSGRPT